MSIQVRSGLAAVALASLLAACGSPADAPEPANESTAATMPETPDRSETAADEAAAGQAPAAKSGEAAPVPTPEKQAPAPTY